MDVWIDTLHPKTCTYFAKFYFIPGKFDCFQFSAIYTLTYQWYVLYVCTPNIVHRVLSLAPYARCWFSVVLFVLWIDGCVVCMALSACLPARQLTRPYPRVYTSCVFVCFNTNKCTTKNLFHYKWEFVQMFFSSRQMCFFPCPSFSHTIQLCYTVRIYGCITLGIFDLGVCMRVRSVRNVRGAS